MPRLRALYVEGLTVEGLTVEEMRYFLTQQFSTYLTRPDLGQQQLQTGKVWRRFQRVNLFVALRGATGGPVPPPSRGREAQSLDTLPDSRLTTEPSGRRKPDELPKTFHLPTRLV